MRSLILAKRRNSEPELAFYTRCDRPRKISVIQSKPPVWLRRGIRRENLKVTSLDFAWIDGYCGLSAQELRARAQQRLVNQFLLERNYGRKVLMRPALQQNLLHPHWANHAKTAFGPRQRPRTNAWHRIHGLLSAARRWPEPPMP